MGRTLPDGSPTRGFGPCRGYSMVTLDVEGVTGLPVTREVFGAADRIRTGDVQLGNFPALSPESSRGPTNQQFVEVHPSRVIPMMSRYTASWEVMWAASHWRSIGLLIRGSQLFGDPLSDLPCRRVGGNDLHRPGRGPEAELEARASWCVRRIGPCAAGPCMPENRRSAHRSSLARKTPGAARVP